MTSLLHQLRNELRALGWLQPDQFSTSQRKTRALIRERSDRIERMIMTQQEAFDAQFDRVQSGVQELRDEIARLAALPAGETVDFSRLTALADNLATDNVPAAAPEPEPTPEPAPPVEEPAPVDPAPETPVDPDAA